MEINERAIIVYGTRSGRLSFLKAYDHPYGEKKAWEKFRGLLSDPLVEDCRIMCLDAFSEQLLEGRGTIEGNG